MQKKIQNNVPADIGFKEPPHSENVSAKKCRLYLIRRQNPTPKPSPNTSVKIVTLIFNLYPAVYRAMASQMCGEQTPPTDDDAAGAPA